MKLLKGDCLEHLGNIPNDSIDMVLTSPPYDNLRTYDNTLEWNFNIFENIALRISSKLKEGGVIVWIVNDKTFKGSETGSSFRQALFFKDVCGLNLHDTMIWKKDSCAFPEQTRYYPVFEYMFIFTKGKIGTFNPIKDRKNKWAGKKKIQGSEYDRRGSRVTRRNKIPYVMDEFGIRYNIWEISTGCGKSSKDKINHPAIFPEQLARDHINSWSNPGDLVVDPFMGSGTTGKICIELNRDFIGIEKNDKYFKEAKERIDREITLKASIANTESAINTSDT